MVWPLTLALSKYVYLPKFRHDKEISIVATDYYMYFYVIVLFPLKVILKLINIITAS